MMKTGMYPASHTTRFGSHPGRNEDEERIDAMINEGGPVWPGQTEPVPVPPKRQVDSPPARTRGWRAWTWNLLEHLRQQLSRWSG